MNELTELPAIEDLPDMNGTEPRPIRALPPVLDVAAFLSTPQPKPDELIKGLLHQGCKLSIGGGSKAHKTWILLDAAISISHGVEWLNFETTRGRVLYVNFELQDWTIHQRINAIAKDKNIEIESGWLSILNLRGYATNYEILLPQIRETIKNDFAMVILDPAYKLYGLTDENSAGDVARLLNAIEQLAVESGAAIAYGQHFSKGNQSQKESIDRVSGSGVWARDPDSLVTFTLHEEDNCFSVESTLRAFPPVSGFVVRWQYPLMRLADELDPAKLKQTVGRKKEHDPKKLLAAIATTTREKPISVSAWACAGNVPRQTLTAYMPEMRRNKWIQTTGEGNTARQYITNEGKAFINGNKHD